jgi:Zn-finger nucleic acid-binding protein
VKGVDIDVCRRHGTWFDAGELEKVAKHYEVDRLAEADSAVLTWC